MKKMLRHCYSNIDGWIVCTLVGGWNTFKKKRSLSFCNLNYLNTDIYFSSTSDLLNNELLFVCQLQVER